MLLLLTEEIQLPANMFWLLQSLTSILSQKKNCQDFLTIKLYITIPTIYWSPTVTPPAPPQKIVAPVTGDLSLKSRNLSLKAGSLRQTTAEAVSTKMVNFVPQQKHRTPGLKQKLKLCMKICNCQKICFVWLNLIKPQGFDIYRYCRFFGNIRQVIKQAKGIDS